MNRRTFIASTIAAVVSPSVVAPLPTGTAPAERTSLYAGGHQALFIDRALTDKECANLRAHYEQGYSLADIKITLTKETP